MQCVRDTITINCDPLPMSQFYILKKKSPGGLKISRSSVMKINSVIKIERYVSYLHPLNYQCQYIVLPRHGVITNS